MRNKIFSLIVIFFAAVGLKSEAQHNLTLHYMNSVPQSIKVNPAMIPDNKWFIGVPGLSSLNFGLTNSGFGYNDLFVPQNNGTRLLDINNVLDNVLAPNNYIDVMTDYEPISFGFRVKKMYFSASVSNRIFSRLFLPRDLFAFLWKGNASDEFLGNTANFTGLGYDIMVYNEYAVGVAREITDKLNVGARLKFLVGAINMDTRNTTLTVSTDANSFATSFNGDLVFNTANVDLTGINDTLIDFDPGRNIDGSTFASTTNKGFAINVGGTYQLMDQLQLQASITDFGSISWQDNVQNWTMDESEFTWEGANVALNYLDTSIGAPDFGELLSDMQDAFVPIGTANKYKTKLPTRMYIGGSWKFSSGDHASLILHGEQYKKFRGAFTASYNVKVKNWLRAQINYTGISRSWTNVGLGFAVNLGPYQLYMMTDNVIGELFPQSNRVIDYRFGMNLTFGRKNKDQDKDGIKDNEDDCPQQAGSKDYHGCPDTDKDGIIDKEDKCPEQEGPADNDGCPFTKSTLHYVNEEGDTLQSSQVDEQFQFEFKDLSLDQEKFLFNLEANDKHFGDAKEVQVKMIYQDGTEELVDVQKVHDKTFEYNREKSGSAKMLLINEAGDTVMTANKVGDMYHFKQLPADMSKMTFLLQGEDSKISKSDVISIKVGDQIIKAKSDGQGYFEYTRIANIEAPKLSLIDENGDTLETVEMNRDGIFEFKNIKRMDNYIYKLEGGDNSEIHVLFINDGEKDHISASKNADGHFMYNPLPTIGNTGIGLLEDNDEFVLLAIEEEKLINNAFDKLQFEHGKPTILDVSKASLTNLAKLMASNIDWGLVIGGHTDDVGDDEGNLILSKKRAESVRDFLQSSGVDPKRIRVKYFGEFLPIADNATEEGRQKNRRVEMKIFIRK